MPETANPPDSASQSARPGRPPALSPEARKQALVDAASRVFLRDGFARATMEKIAQEAHMSKRTLYEFFPDKVALLLALLVVQDEQMPDPASRPCSRGNPRQSLTQLLSDLIDFIFVPQRIGLTRLTLTESPHIPELAGQFEASAVRSTDDMVIARLVQLQQAGEIRVEDPARLANLMLGSLIGAWLLKALASATPWRPSPEAVAERIHDVINAFAGELGLPQIS